MVYRTTTSYGTWLQVMNTLNLGSEVLGYIEGADSDWRQLVDDSGALHEMELAYYREIEDALPPSVSLCGDEFIGPYETEEGEFDDYPCDEDGRLKLRELIEPIDVGPIVEYHDPVTLLEIGRDIMQSKAAEPAKVASRAMSRLGIQPFATLPHPESKRPQHYYYAGEVREALAGRPGRGTRTDREETA